MGNMLSTCSMCKGLGAIDEPEKNEEVKKDSARKKFRELSSAKNGDA